MKLKKLAAAALAAVTAASMSVAAFAYSDGDEIEVSNGPKLYSGVKSDKIVFDYEDRGNNVHQLNIRNLPKEMENYDAFEITLGDSLPKVFSVHGDEWKYVLDVEKKDGGGERYTIYGFDGGDPSIKPFVHIGSTFEKESDGSLTYKVFMEPDPFIQEYINKLKTAKYALIRVQKYTSSNVVSYLPDGSESGSWKSYILIDREASAPTVTKPDPQPAPAPEPSPAPAPEPEKPSGTTKPAADSNPDTGAAGLSAVIGAALLAGGAVCVSKKRRK